MSSAENNPGNFANRPKEEVAEIGRKGGQSSHSGGFASMDPDKQVFSLSIYLTELQRESASQGGQAAQETGKPHRFTSEEAAEAGRKGGSARKSD
jgi:general stress protein YciG